MMEDIDNVLVMIIDDNPENLKYLASIVKKSGYEYVMSLNGNQALEFLKSEKPDIILLDIMMPEIDGYEVCQKLKSNENTKDIPIIFVTAKAEIDEIVKGFEVGGVDYVTKPFNFVILESRIRTHIELKRSKDKLKKYIAKLEETNAILEKEKERSDYLANRDYLTGIFNRRYMVERMKEEYYRFLREKEKFTIGIFDIDDFKKINDTYGHECGDFILVSLTKSISEFIRKMDCFARWGGEEFIVMLPKTDLEGAAVLFEKIRGNVENTKYSYNGFSVNITFTCGIAEISSEETIDNCIVRADKALYKGKISGKNQIVRGE